MEEAAFAVDVVEEVIVDVKICFTVVFQTNLFGYLLYFFNLPDENLIISK